MAEQNDPYEPIQLGAPRVLLEYVVRCYDSELETERRNATRRSFVLTAILAAIGLGVFRIGWMREHASAIEPIGLLWVLRALIVVSVLLFGHALIVLLAVPVPGTRRAKAGRGLRLSSGISDAPQRVPNDLAVNVVFRVTNRAYLELQGRNRHDREDIDRAQQALVLALVPLFLAIVCYNLIARSK
jgi:hypothetical protein